MIKQSSFRLYYITSRRYKSMSCEKKKFIFPFYYRVISKTKINYSPGQNDFWIKIFYLHKILYAYKAISRLIIYIYIYIDRS